CITKLPLAATAAILSDDRDLSELACVLPRAVNVLAVSEHDYHKPRVNRDILRRIHPEAVLLTVMEGVLQRQGQKIISAAEIDFAQPLAQPGRTLRYFDFFNAQSAVFVLEHEVEKADHMRPQHFAGDTHSADLVRRHRGVGAGFHQTLRKFQIDAAGHNADIGVFLPREHGDDEIFFVAGKSGNQSLGAVDAELVEQISVSRVSDHVQHLAILTIGAVDHALDVLFVVVDHHVRTMGPSQFANGVKTGVTHAADNVVVFQLADSLEHLASPENIGDLTLDQESSHRREGVHREHHPEDDHKHIEDSQRRIACGVYEFAVAHSSQGDDGHVQSIEEVDRRAAEQAISHHRDNENNQEGEEGKLQLAT